MKLFLSLVLCFVCLLGYSQSFNFRPTHYRFFINGKALAGPTSTENKFGKSFTVGAGVYFFKNHSLSTDYVYFNNNYEHESLSASGYYENNGTYDVSYRRYLIFNYRYQFLQKSDFFHPYLSVFMKLGKESRLFDDGIEPRETTELNYSADINEYGAVIGAKIDFSTTSRMGLDFSFGLVNAQHYIHYGKKHSPWNNGEYVYSYNDSFWKPNIRLNLYVNLFELN
jgi:hypothetical protein